jgi:hypothetical protein
MTTDYIVEYECADTPWDDPLLHGFMMLPVIISTVMNKREWK